MDILRPYVKHIFFTSEAQQTQIAKWGIVGRSCQSHSLFAMLNELRVFVLKRFFNPVRDNISSK